MKNTRIFTRCTALFFAALLPLGLLAGCGKAAESRSIIMAAPPAPDTLLDERAVSSAVSASTPAEEKPPEDVAMSLSVATRSLSLGYAGNEAGCYHLLSYNDGSADLVYTDYTALQMDILPEPQQPDAALRGHLAGIYGGANPVWAGDHLFLFKQRASQALVASQGENAHAAVIRLNADGTGPAACTFGVDTTVRPAGAVLWDGAALYFIVDQQVGDATEQALMKLDAETMEQTELHRLEPGFDYTIEGFWQKGPVICAASTLPATNDPAFNEAWNNRTYSLYAVGMLTGQRTHLFDWRQGQPTVMMGSTFYYYNADDDSVYALNADTGAAAAIASGFAPKTYSTAQMLAPLDGKVRLQFSGNQGYDITDYVIDPATGAVSQHTPKDLGDNVSVMAENSAVFLVQNGDRFVSRDLVEPEYKPDSSTSYNDKFVTVSEYSLIPKAAYWAGQRTFTDITDRVYDKKK